MTLFGWALIHMTGICLKMSHLTQRQTYIKGCQCERTEEKDGHMQAKQSDLQ